MNRLKLLALLALISPQISIAAPQPLNSTAIEQESAKLKPATQVASATSTNKPSLSEISLVEIAGRQRMLSQRIVKAHLFVGAGIRPDRASEQLSAATAAMNKGHEVLLSSASTPEAQQLLAYIGTVQGEFVGLASADYDVDKAKKLIDLGESMLEASEEITSVLAKNTSSNESHIVAIAGRQRMLSQRIAQYYIAYYLGFNDPAIMEQLRKAMGEFEAAQTELKALPDNSKEVIAELAQVEKLWNTVRGYLSSPDKKSLPVIVFTSMDSIMEDMDRITNYYAEKDKKQRT